MKKAHGFTLIELMIVVAIIGILTAIAYPSYMRSIYKSNRADAKAALNDASARMERCFTVNSDYDDCITAPYDSSEGFYKITAVGNGATFLISAAAQAGPQIHDDDCKNNMSLNNLGERLPDNDICW